MYGRKSARPHIIALKIENNRIICRLTHLQQESWPSADSYFQSSTPEEDIFIREKRNMFIHLVASVVNPSMREPLHGHQWKHHRQHTDSTLSKLCWWSHCIAWGHLCLVYKETDEMFSWTSRDFHFLEPIQVNFQFLSSPPSSLIRAVLDVLTRCCVSSHSEATAVVAQHFLYCCDSL